MRKFITLLIVTIPCLAYHPSLGQFVKNVSKVGTTAAPFLEIEAGSRALGMGGAFVAVSNDVTALYWNPAGIARLKKSEAMFDHADWLADTRFDYAALAMSIGRNDAIGLSFITFGMDEMEVRTVFYPEGTGEKFSANDMAICLSYARNLTDRFSIGFTGKYIQQKLWHMKASSIALDVGTLFTTGLKNMRIGMSISNFGNKMHLYGKDTMVKHDIDVVKYGNNEKINAHLDTGFWSLPLLFRVGIAMEFLQTDMNRLTFALDALHPNDNTESINVGFEYALNEMFFLRGGYKSLFQRDAEEGLSAGAGFAYNLTGSFDVVFDYAYTDFGVLQNVQRFSIALRF